MADHLIATPTITDKAWAEGEPRLPGENREAFIRRVVLRTRHHSRMAVGRAERLAVLKPRLVATFGDSAETLRIVGDVFTLMEMAWHDCYGDVTPPDDVIEDVLLCSQGTLEGFVAAAHLAVIDRRDLSVWATSVR